MADDSNVQRIASIAAAARVPLDAESAARVARTTAPVIARLAADPLEFPFETEPASFLWIQRQELSR